MRDGEGADLAAALAITLVSAYALYHVIERPAQLWSSAFSCRRSAQEAVAPHDKTGGFAPAAAGE